MLIECAECTTQFAPDQPKCPHCGAPAPVEDSEPVVPEPEPTPEPDPVVAPDKKTSGRK